MPCDSLKCQAIMRFAPPPYLCSNGLKWLGRVFARCARGDSAAVSTDELPILHRLAIVYLALPVAIWLLGWFQWWVGVPMTALLAVGLWKALSGSWRVSVTPVALILLLLALLWVMLSSAGGLFDAVRGDWPVHRAMLLDLGRGGWPTYITDYLHDEPPLLRYYLAYYMAPALVGKWLGAAALNWAVPLWTWGGVGLIALLFTRGLPTLRAALLAVIILIFFSGIDVVEYMLRDGLPDTARLLRDTWGEGHLMFVTNELSPMFLEYQTNALTFKNSPQHFITGGLGTLLIIQLCRHARFLAVGGIVLATCLFWSPLLSIGLLPLMGVLFIKNGIRPFLTLQNLFIAPPLAGLIALYFTSGKVNFPTGWLWEAYDGEFQMLADMFIFYLAEFALLALLIAWLRPGVVREPFFAVSLLVLILTPWFWYGGPNFSELTLRVVVPSLFALSCYATHAVVSRLPEFSDRPASIAGIGAAASEGRRWLASEVSRRVGFILLLCVLGVGAVSAVYEFAWSFNNRGVLPYERTDHSLLAAGSNSWVALQFTTRGIPQALGTLLRDNERKGGPKGDLIIRSKYEVYRGENHLIYVNRNCNPNDEKRLEYFLRVYPVERDVLLTPRPQGLAYEILNFQWDRLHHWGGGDCLATRRLPDYDIARIHTGQRAEDGTVVWGTGYDFETGEQFGLLDGYRAEYRSIVTGEPLIVSDFHVYLRGRALSFVKDACAPTATQPTFFLHIIPADEGDLPSYRRQHGFDNMDFNFAEYGVRFDGKCMATVILPPYDIIGIRTGQYTADGQIWKTEFAFKE